METQEIKTKKCDCVEQCESCTGVQPVETEKIGLNKISSIKVNRYLSKFEDAVIYVIKTGFQDRFVTILEDAPTSSIEKLFEGTKIETEEKFGINLSEKEKETKEKTYEYEMFFKSQEKDIIKIDGWYPIDSDKIKNINKIDEYIKNGILRKIYSDEKTECIHEYSDGTSTGWYVCTKCGDMY